MPKALCAMGIVLLLVSSAWSDEYWRGWCAGYGNVRKEQAVLETRRHKTGVPPGAVYVSPEEAPFAWYIHGRPYTFLCNGCNSEQAMLWVTCPSGETTPYDWETPDHGRPVSTTSQSK